jgi:hypothetical protein
MEIISNAIVSLSEWLRPYSAHIGLSMVACSLVLLDGYIHSALKQLVRPYAFFIRVGAFIALFTFGYAMLAAFVTPLVVAFIGSLSAIYLAPVVIISFIMFGVLLEMKR